MAENMHVGYLRDVRGYTSRLLIDERRHIVWRWAMGGRRLSLQRHYAFLERFCTSAPIPEPRGTYTFANCLVTQESLLPGSPREAHTFDLTTHGQRALNALAPVYHHTQQQTSLDWVKALHQYDQLIEGADGITKYAYGALQQRFLSDSPTTPPSAVTHAWIHGDLTFRNILVDGDNVGLIDFDRSEISFSEFDSLLLHYDLLTHQSAEVTYETFVTLLIDSLRDTSTTNRILRTFYTDFPAFAGNEQARSAIHHLFILRCLAYVIHDAMIKGKNLTFLAAALALL